MGDVCEAVSPLFYGYNPFNLVAFLLVWFTSFEEQSPKLVQSYLNSLVYPMALVPDYLSISQNIDWP